MKRAMLILAGLALVLFGIRALTSPGAILGKPLTAFEKEWSVPEGELRDLQILSDDPVRITFKESTDGSQSVYVKGQGPDKLSKTVSSTQVEAGKLIVDLRYPNRFLPNFRFGFHFDQPENDLIVTLAPGYELDNLAVHIDSGGMDVSNITAKTANFTSDNGSMRLSGITGGQISIKVDSGSIEMQEMMADSLDVKVDSGNLAGSSIKAETSVKIDSGSVRLEGTTGAIKIQTDSGDVRLQKDDSSDTEIRTDSGNVYIELPSFFAGSLDLKSDSGKITAPEAKNETPDRIRVRTGNGKVEIEQKE